MYAYVCSFDAINLQKNFKHLGDMKKRLELLGTDDENWQFISLLKLPKGRVVMTFMILLLLFMILECDYFLRFILCMVRCIVQRCTQKSMQFLMSVTKCLLNITMRNTDSKGHEISCNSIC